MGEVYRDASSTPTNSQGSNNNLKPDIFSGHDHVTDHVLEDDDEDLRVTVTSTETRGAQNLHLLNY